MYEGEFGHVRRPTHTSTPYDATRFEVCNQKWTALADEGLGAAVLNDCKYGVNVEGNSINLTLLKAALAPDMTADQGLHTFTYALYAWNGPLAASGVVREAYDLNVPATLAPGAVAGGKAVSLFGVSAPNIIIETVKPAEDGSGDIVVRLYESMRTATRCALRTQLPVRAVVETDMLERRVKAVAFRDGVCTMAFRPFEIKTLRLHP